MKNLTGCPILTTWLPPQIHQNPQQQKVKDSSNEHSRSGGVAKVSFGLPMLHGKHFLLCFPCSVGTSKTLFATPPQREGLFFHFSENFPARSSKILKSMFSNHCVRVTCSRILHFPMNFHKYELHVVFMISKC